MRPSTNGRATLEQVAQAARTLAAGDPGSLDVRVVLPDGTETPGRIREVGAETEPAVPAAPGSPDQGQTAQAAVAITVDLPDQAAVRDYDSGPVTVRYVASERKNVLTVPVAALLALAEGGYGVEIVADGGTRVVPVEVGLFTDARVEVRGNGLAAGMLVGVPE